MFKRASYLVPFILIHFRFLCFRLYWLDRAVQFSILVVVLRFLLLRSSVTRAACFSLLSIVLRMCRMIV